MTSHTYRYSLFRGCLFLAFASCVLPAVPPVTRFDIAAGDTIETAATRGSIVGRASNRATGDYMERARIVIEGTTLETFTDSGGNRLTGVGAGTARMNVSYENFSVELRAKYRDAWQKPGAITAGLN